MDTTFIHYTRTLIWHSGGRVGVTPSACGLTCGDEPGSVGPLLTTSETLVTCPTCAEWIAAHAVTT